ncbi:MAG: sodium:alanine symporter family protein [Tissierellia bacterium]|nr:sodium:alanine symporter family protein [Tissierellia bacterium]
MNSDAILSFAKSINGVLWGPILLIALLGTGIMFTFKLKFIQIGKLKTAIKQIFRKSESKTDEVGLSPFQSLATAIAAQVGTGNLAGVATAMVSGGPGAIFWMWISAFFGMATIFAEAVLGQLFRKTDNGELVGGPAYYIKYGLKNNFLAGFFAVSIIVALGFMGNMVQSNSMAVVINNAFNIPTIVTGIVVAILAYLIFAGGVERIGSFTEKIVPFMAALYILGTLVIVIFHYENIIPAFKMIINGAFNTKAVVGGAIGVTIKESIRYGVARGLFSNEAGMGSTPHAHAVAKVDDPVQQGLIAILGVIVDTGIVCTLTALVILTTGVMGTGLNGAELTQKAFEVGLSGIGPNIGGYFVAITLFFFAFSTITGWYYFGETNIKFLFGNDSVKFYRIIVLIMLILGTTLDVTLVWELADIFNALMVIPNLIALVGLSNLVVKAVNDFDNSYELKGKKFGVEHY